MPCNCGPTPTLDMGSPILSAGPGRTMAKPGSTPSADAPQIRQSSLSGK